MNNIPGITLQNVFLIMLSYLLILLINKKTRSNSALILISVLTFHHIIAYLYGFHLNLPVNEVDPATFLRKAEKCINSGACGYLGYHLYVTYLAKMLVLGGSLYFVLLLNVLYFVISIYFFIGIAELLGLKGNRKAYLVFYSLWPSVVYFTTLHYREPFELYLLMAGIYFGLSGSKSESFTKLSVSMILLFAMGLLHIKGLLFLSAILFIIAGTYKISFSTGAMAKRLLLLMVMGIGIFVAYTTYTKNVTNVSARSAIESATVIISEKFNSIIGAEDKSGITGEREEQLSPIYKPGVSKTNTLASSEKLSINTGTENKTGITVKRGEQLAASDKPGLSQVASSANKDISFVQKMINKIMNYRAILLGQREVRTAFVASLNDENLAFFILSFLLVYFEYLFSPFIFQVNTLPEVVAYIESLLRVILFVSSIVMLMRVTQTRWLFLIYLAITAMWTIGVVSFGASIRHHIMTNWILVLLGVPVISEYVRMKIAKRKDASGKLRT